MTEFRLLDDDEGPPTGFLNPGGASEAVFVCEHACPTLPRRLGTLGLDAAALASHVAWDPGALALARHIAAELDAPLYYQRFSRLVCDCNRPAEAESLMPVRSEIYDIPGNANIAPAEREARIREIHAPFHDGLARLLSARETAGRRTVLVTIHSFTPVYFGKLREVEIGILHDRDTRLADAMLGEATERGGYNIRRNQPYGPADGVLHTLKVHAEACGRACAMIEVRNDLVRDDAGVAEVGQYLASLLRTALARLHSSPAEPQRLAMAPAP